MAKIDLTLGKAMYHDVFGYAADTIGREKVARDLQTSGFYLYPEEGQSDWRRLVEEQGGKIVAEGPPDGFIYEDWTGGSRMDGIK
jgi:hypothetical protein